MSLTDTRLYENNAKSTLLRSIDSSATLIPLQLGEGVRFPSITDSSQYFLVTIENAGEYEICKVTGKSADELTVERAQEGSTAKSFPLGAQVQMRVTKGILQDFARLSDRLGDVESVDDIPSVGLAKGNSYLCSVTDDAGNPIIATKSSDRWRFPTHSIVAVSGSADSSTTTSVTSTLLAGLPVVPGRYLLNFTSGIHAGVPKYITGISGSTISWDTPLSSAPVSGDGFEVLVSNAYQLSQVSNLLDESLINAIIFGAE